MTRTGNHSSHGKRYGIIETFKTNEIVCDADIGALDAPLNIATGSHTGLFYAHWPFVSAKNRRGTTTHIPVSETAIR